jgi:hypothetical protein
MLSSPLLLVFRINITLCMLMHAQFSSVTCVQDQHHIVHAHACSVLLCYLCSGSTSHCARSCILSSPLLLVFRINITLGTPMHAQFSFVTCVQDHITLGTPMNVQTYSDLNNAIYVTSTTYACTCGLNKMSAYHLLQMCSTLLLQNRYGHHQCRSRTNYLERPANSDRQLLFSSVYKLTCENVQRGIPIDVDWSLICWMTSNFI